VTNLKLSFRVRKGLTLNAGVNNILDRNYALTEGFPEAGRTFFANAEYEF
jgi:iron complex outermembrane receptor protein